MGIGKRMLGIFCGVLLCIMLAMVLCKGKQEEKPRGSEIQDSYVMKETSSATPLVTESPEPTATQAPAEPQEPMETEVPVEEKDTPLPMMSSTPLPTPKSQATPTPKPVLKETVTPLPAITNTPVPLITVTPIPVITHTPAPTERPTPIPEASGKEEEHVHQFEVSVWELPTCEKGGYYNNICKECGVVECVTQDPIPHEVEDIVIQEGNCMEDQVIRHICKMCEQPVKSDTRYTVYDKHSWKKEQIDGVETEYCEWCGVAK